MRTRRGSIDRPGTILVGAALVLVICIALITNGGRRRTPDASGGTLLVHCAAGIRAPVAELAAHFEQRTGTRIELNYGGSGTLLSSIQAGSRGDLYIAGDVSFVERAQAAGTVRESVELAEMRPVLAVAHGNPLAITALSDLERADVRVGLGNPEAAAIGRVARSVLQLSGRWEAVHANLKVEKPTVNELASDLALGALDVCVVWDATLANYDGLQVVRVDALEQRPQRVTSGILAVCVQPARALAFARYMASSDLGAAAFQSHGFTPSAGDAFEQEARLLLMSGAMLRPAVEATLDAFEQREGFAIDRVYNGCGTLVAQMRTGRLPDAYFACDSSFLDMVQPLFESGVELVQNPMVLLVPAGNPRGLLGLDDLCREDLRVGLGHPEKSALGALTQKLLTRARLVEALAQSGNLKVESPTGDLLVNQMRAGSLDATIVYTSNAALAGAELDRIELDLVGAVAVQPFAILRDSPHARTLQRLLQSLRGEQSRGRFAQLGFRWLEAEQP
ncbi:MAG: molybdate transport system substrate-binding protein [Planctomycetota bacterium]|jgi:molybdate transport system substrate-binding protein